MEERMEERMEGGIGGFIGGYWWVLVSETYRGEGGDR